ncbi:hypothetical protein F4815DRAFT_441750 [Daldinia loculata]|nr:hypothetical protein F4815DRAFT_441750 [Daldinia loculata]
MTSPANWVPRKKVAIVGSGSAGIGALWALNRTHHDVYLYEAADRLGGHTNTVEWKKGKFTTLVDTGFIVLNEATYPNFINFLNYVKVKTVPTQMTFGVSRDRGKFEWAGTSLDSIFCQRKNLFSLRMWRLIFDIIRFNKFALDLLKDDDNDVYLNTEASTAPMETIGQYLDREGYSEAFRNDYLIPLTAAVWSTSPDKCTLEFPAVTLVRFMWNHHLLTTFARRPDWLTLENGAKSYVNAVMRGFPPNHLFLKTTVKHLSNDKDGLVRLHLENGKTEVYDHVILATHGPQAYQIIKPSATAKERAIMSSFETSENTCVLHSDLSHMPRRQNSWSAWNYLAMSSPWTNKDIDQVSLTYNMNILQHIPRQPFGDVLVTLNPIQEPKPETVQGRYSYSHPLYNPAAIRAQQALPIIQNTRGISYAGAWTKYGFHEDGFSSGLALLANSSIRQNEHPLPDLMAGAPSQHIVSFAMGMRIVPPRSYPTGSPPERSEFLGEETADYSCCPRRRDAVDGTRARICQTTGWGGQPIRAPGHGPSSDDADFDPASRLIPVTDARRIRVTFNASVSDVLPWKFVPQQREVRVLPGETALAFYTATNRSDSDIIGVATYSVTPAQVAPYFSKIQCFCFEEQRLNAGETVDMPVFFYLDPDMLNDLNMRGINEVTLSYTFFKAKYDNNGNFKSFPTT